MCSLYKLQNKMDLHIIVVIMLTVFCRGVAPFCEIHHQTANCQRKELETVPQDLRRDIIVLDLRWNFLTTLENNIFKKYSNLTCLFLDNNRLHFLEINAFSGLKSLKNLSMSGNSLDLGESYPRGVFESLLSLEYLDIEQNMPEGTQNESQINYPFFGYLLNLISLSIDLVSSPVFHNCGFDRLKILKRIVFDRCSIGRMSSETFSNLPKNIEEIYFKNCLNIYTVDVNVLRPFMKLQVLSLYHSNMKLSSALKLLYPFINKRIKTIEITRVNPGYVLPNGTPNAVIVTSSMMKHLQHICVSTLILAQNGIVDFKPNSLLSYKYPHCFENIILTGNRFSIVNGFKMKELLTLSTKLTNLTLFDLSYNPLSYGNIKFTMKLPHEYSFRNQQKTALCENTANEHFTSDENTYTKSWNTFPNDERFFFPLPPKLKTLRLRYYMSDQILGGPIVFLNASNLRYLDMSYFDENHFPNITLDGFNNIEYIDLSGISSWKKSISLFKNSKTAILKFAGISGVIQKSENFFSFIPKVETLDISWNNLWQLRYDTFSDNKNLTSLIMQSNLFSYLPTALMTISNLKFLDLRWNILDTVNETMRNWIDKRQKQNGSFKLYLQGNIFQCTCETVEFIRWINKTKVVFDYPNKEYKCILSNGSVTTTSKVLKDFHKLFSTCNGEIWLRIGIGLLVSFIVCVVPIAIMLNFKWQIAYWIYRKFRKVVQREMKQKYRYDIYVSYSYDNIHWIKNTLLPKIETSWEMKICLEDRDILAGDICADAISNSIAQSRHVLFIITDAFSDKHWGKFEIERAKYEKYTRNLQQIIVIKKQVSVGNFPSEFASIWKDIVLIDWCKDESENGWDKLRMSLFSEFI